MFNVSNIKKKPYFNIFFVFVAYRCAEIPEFIRESGYESTFLLPNLAAVIKKPNLLNPVKLLTETTEILENLPCPFLLLNSDFDIVYHNQSAVLKFPDIKDKLEDSFYSYFSSSHTLDLLDHMKNVFDTGVSQTISYKGTFSENQFGYFKFFLSKPFKERPLLMVRIEDITKTVISGLAIDLINSPEKNQDINSIIKNVLQRIAIQYQIPFVFLGFKSDGEDIEVLAHLEEMNIPDSFSYPLEGTPCKLVYDQKKTIYYPHSIQESYPEDIVLQEWNVHSYLGVPIMDADAQVIGHICMTAFDEIEKYQELTKVLKIYSKVILGEIRRIKDKKALVKIQNLLASFLKNSQEFIWAIDKDFKVIYFNDRFLELMEKIRGKGNFKKGDKLDKFSGTMLNVTPEERLEWYRMAFEGHAHKKEFHYSIPNSDEELYETLHFTPLKNENGAVEACMIFAQNNTEENKTALALKDKNEELQQYINSNLQLENFAYFASHDLREPIRTISSFTQLLKREMKGDLSESALEYMDFITDGVNRMNLLIEGLLKYSLVSTQDGKFDYFNPEALLEEIKLNLYTNIQETNANIFFESLPLQIYGDQIKLTQLFQNLIANSIKFRKPDVNPIISIKGEESNTHWIFEICDNGIGIDPSFYKQIFILFRKLHSIKKYKGSGIGLSLCKKIVELHNGEITVSSGDNAGTCFKLSIAKP